MEKFNIVLKDKISHLPKSSGVYCFFENKKPIYIGKAINIRERVKSHFHQPSYRDNLFIHKVEKVGFAETDSEIEALILEANLIKKYLPKFNVIWRDDKNYFYVAVTSDEKPAVFITHQKNNLKTKYIGPFVEGNALKKTLKFLRRVFPYYTSKKHSQNKCTWCHLGLCPGPNPDLLEYKKNIKKLILILRGKRKSVLNSLKKEMRAFSNSQKYENASEVKGIISALERVMSHAHVIENHLSFSDGRPKMKDGWRKTEKILRGILGLRKNISRIECYDISNIQGKNATGSMAVFINGKTDKNQYKKFRIKIKQEPNDIAMLKEILTRRFFHPEWNYPDVILIDGGNAQLNAAIKIKNRKRETGTIKVISIAKRNKELFIEGRKQPILLKSLQNGIYNLIIHLDDEAHRFAIAYHIKLRKKELLDI